MREESAEAEGCSVGQGEEENMQPSSPGMSATGPCSAMQLGPIGQAEEEAIGAVLEEPCMLNAVETDKLKAFCAKFLKTIAPPLLQEIENSTKL